MLSLSITQIEAAIAGLENHIADIKSAVTAVKQVASDLETAKNTALAPEPVAGSGGLQQAITEPAAPSNIGTSVS